MTGPRKARRSPQTVLERRYRRLLALYPGAYLAVNGEEMLGVVMSSAAPDQSRPDPGEAVSLLLSGIRMRFGRLWAGAGDSAWRDASAVLALLGSVLLAAIYGRGVAGYGKVVTLVPVSISSFPPSPFPHGGPLFVSWGVPVADIVFTAVWSLTAVAAAMRWRRATAAGAVLGAIGLTAYLVAGYSSSPSSFVASWWLLLLAVTIALASVTVLASPKSEERPVSWPMITIIGVAAAAFGAAPAGESSFIIVTRRTVSSPLFSIQGLLDDGLLALLALAVLVVVVRLDPAARRRVLVLAAPIAAAAALVKALFGGFLAASPRFFNPVLLTAPQWVSLLAVPALALAVGMVWLGRHERMLRRVAAGPGGEPAAS